MAVSIDKEMSCVEENFSVVFPSVSPNADENGRGDTVKMYINIAAAARDTLSEDQKRSRQKWVQFLSGVVEWYATLDPEVREAVWTGKDAVELIASKAHAAKEGEGRKVDFGEAQRICRLMLDRMEELHGKTPRLLGDDLNTRRGEQKGRKTSRRRT